jgi:hypothetical protein
MNTIDTTAIYSVTTGSIISYSFDKNLINTNLVENDLTVNGDINLNGVSMLSLLENIQTRLNILVPDPAKLEKYQALKDAYEHYKLMESLLKD